MVQTDGGITEEFKVRVGLQQGSTLSPLLFLIVMYRVSKKVRGGLSLEVLYADDLVLMAQSLDELRDKLRKWKRYEGYEYEGQGDESKFREDKGDVGRGPG